MTKPVLEPLNGTRDTWKIKSLAALPGGQAILYNYVEENETRQVLKVNNQGEVITEMYRCVLCGEIQGTIVLGSKLYVCHNNGTLVQIRLTDGTVLNVYHIPNVGDVLNYGSLSSDPKNIPDTDLLVMADINKREIFTYRISTKEKKTVVRGLFTPQSVSYLFINSDIYFVACEYLKPGGDKISVYNSSWHFIRSFGSLGSQDDQLNNPEAAIELPKGTVIVADRVNDRLSEFSIEGHFIRHILNQQGMHPSAISFAYPYLWVVQNFEIPYRFKLYEN